MCVIRVLLVDDDALVADGFRALLEKEPDIEIVGIAGDGEAALGLVQQHNPDVIVMDVRMPILDGVKTTRQLRARNPQCNILLLTAYNDDEYVRDGIQAGAHGYLLKRAARTELLESIREVARGGAVVHRDVLPTVLKALQEGARRAETPSIPMLTPRERGVLRELARGYTNREIADVLDVTEYTINTHMRRILSKFGVGSRQEAIAAAQQHGLVRGID